MKWTALFFLLGTIALSCENDQKSQSPNVIIVMTDDQGWGDFSLHGNDSISTPHIDRFATEGIQFDRFYVSPVCAPTRASLLTGRYHLRTGTSWVTHRKEVMREKEFTIAEAFKAAGYTTGIYGKWHNGEQYPNHPNGQGFDEFFGFAAGHWNNYFDTHLEHNGKTVKTEGYITDVLTDKAIDFITDNKENPFFCYLSYNAPHGPFQVPDKYFEKYKAIGLSDKNACIYGMNENIDDNFQKIINTLEEHDLRENTIVIFLTDNGPNGVRFNGGMRGTKASVHEGGVRVPLFIQWPKKLRHSKMVRQLTSHIDIMPTLVELCGISLPEPVKFDGISLVPLLTAENSIWRERNIYTIQNDGTTKDYPSSVRNNQFRLVKQSEDDIRLFDMIADPGQRIDISEEQKEVSKRLLEDLEFWFKDVSADGYDPPAISIGFPQSMATHLPAHESILSANLQFEGGMGWANDWIKNWQSENDFVSWNINVMIDGKYRIIGHYVTDDIGVILTTTIGNDMVSAKVNNDLIPPFIESPDRVKRGEVYEREWYELTIGEVDLKKGETQLNLQIKKLKENNRTNIKGISMERIL